MPPSLLDRSKIRRWHLAWMFVGALGIGSEGLAGGVGAGGLARDGNDRMVALPNNDSLLVDYFDALARDGDIESFRRNVAARYNEATLARLLDSTEIKARRASVLSLGLFGEYAASNRVLAGALKDKDPLVRELAQDAMWSVWFRAGTPAQNASLATIRNQISDERFAEAILGADRLISQAPDFAEAYNQRAIAHFLLGQFADSAVDCRRVLERNPYHFGAMGGLGQCLHHDLKRDEAIVVYRRMLELQPYNEGIRNLIAVLEAGR